MALQLTSFACLGILREIATSSAQKFRVEPVRLAGMVLHSLNAQQSGNFTELRNALSQPPESILSSFRI